MADGPEGLTATEVGARLGIAVPTAFHLLSTLVDEGLLAKDQRRYVLGPAAGRIADGFMGPLAVSASLLAPLRQLAETTLESAYVGAWRQGEIVVLRSFEGAHAVRVEGVHTGFAYDAHARASGKMLLATLEQDALDAYLATHPLRSVTEHTITDEKEFRKELRKTRQRGYSIDREEFRDGVTCLGVPIEDARVVHGTYTLAVPVDRLRKNRDRYLAALRNAAAQAVKGLSASGHDGR